jgi:dolichyl-phosphate-mannose--protein O-mannosyl transferase
MRGLQLRAPAGLRSGQGRWLLPPWIAPAFLICAVVLLPWATFLILTLPRNYTANHWRVAWGGFDIGLGVAMVATALAVARRSPFAEVAAAVTGTLLVCDAWFDVVTSFGTDDQMLTLLTALAIELPLAFYFALLTRRVLVTAIRVTTPEYAGAALHSMPLATDHAKEPVTP